MIYNEAKKHLTTLRDTLRFAVSRFSEANLFFGHGTTNAYDEAAYLILRTLHLPHDQLDPFLDATLMPNEIEDVLKMLERRVKERIPSSYLTHEAWLGDYKFYVDERVIVPRSFIAELLDEQLSPWVEAPEAVENALDLCTGSGCLAILMAISFPNARIDAVDISEDALAVAQRNVADYGMEQQIRLVCSDMFTELGDRRYDLIVSNPPYVNAPSMQALPHEYRHEPVQALTSGVDGLDHIRIILREAAKHLSERGILVVEAGHNLETISQTFPHFDFTWMETSAGNEHVFLLTREQLLRQS
ncbi:MAG: 50S ribosomal protein L3 N(5)-glutamine methyltransferase [Sulfuricellaceae bacterium]